MTAQLRLVEPSHEKTGQFLFAPPIPTFVLGSI